MGTPSRQVLTPPLLGSMLDAGQLPVEALTLLARREGWRPRPVYQAHRWFARRFGSAFRALLTAAALPADGDFWEGYYSGVSWHGRTVLDPFVGGGTSVVEAQRLGASTIGVDIDAVACAITRFELTLSGAIDVLPALDDLKAMVGNGLAPFYRTATDDGGRDVLHYFWVQTLPCRGCGRRLEAHPHYQLAYESEGTRQWVFCPRCSTVREIPRDQKRFKCAPCGEWARVEAGPVRGGEITCASCGESERLIEAGARIGTHPTWKLFALETIEPPIKRHPVPMSQRFFRPATATDRAIYAAAELALHSRGSSGGTAWIPEREIPRAGRSDDRLIHYGYHRYRELFNARQLLHLSLTSEAIASLESPTREALAIAFSDHLATNCMMTYYAFGWRRLAPLFSLRAFRHITRPVEINPWLDGTGRGTFPNAVRSVQRAIEWARSPREPDLEGGFRPAPSPSPGRSARPVCSEIFQTSAARLSFLPDASVDFVLTDPPYYDKIAYSELSDFFLPWLQQFGLVPRGEAAEEAFTENLGARGSAEAPLVRFRAALVACFAEIRRVLRSKGRIAFTYQHHEPGAWEALAEALFRNGLRVVQVFPMLGDSSAGLHKHEGSSSWDAVLVVAAGRRPTQTALLRLSDEAHTLGLAHYHRWASRLDTDRECRLSAADRNNFFRACLVGAALGLGCSTRPRTGRCLSEVLVETAPKD